MSVAHKAPAMKELSLEDLQDNFAVVVNNAITEGRTADIQAIVHAHQAQHPVTVSIIDRVRAFFIG